MLGRKHMAISIREVKGIGAQTAAALAEHGYRQAEDLAAARPEDLKGIPGFGLVRANLIIEAARALTSAVSKPKPTLEPVSEPEPATVQEPETEPEIQEDAQAKSGKKKKKKNKEKKKKREKEKKKKDKARKTKKKK